MSEVDQRFHELWLGMVQPVEGLVVSVPVLVDAQCAERQPPHVQQTLIRLCPPTRQGDAGPEGYAIADLGVFLDELLGLGPALFDAGDAIPEAVSLYVPEGKQTIRPTLALRRHGIIPTEESAYQVLIWDLPAGLDLDKPESVTGTWDYPPAAKLDRLLRHARVPIGLLTNREVVRLIYAPHGESSGSITFRVDDMARVGGRPILDAFVMLLSANRLFGVAAERALPALLAESRKRQANVTNELADQVFEALQILLRGFEAAAERDGRDLLEDALAREGDHLYKGLLTVLLRLVFVLYAEDRGLLPVDHPLYEQHLSVLSLFEDLQADRGAYPDSMSRRHGAWGRLVAVFRAVYLGVEHGGLRMPARRGSLFDPHTYPFLEGWGPAGSAPITQPEDRAAVRVPTVDDETIFRVLEKLLILDGQRLSYRALDVEQIGSVYEALMGYHVERTSTEAVCLKPHRLWVTSEEVLEVPAARRAKWIKETIGLNASQSEKLAEELRDAKPGPAAIEALSKHAAGGKKADPALSKALAGQLVLQPGTERRRTSSHYTPRSLSAPIVQRTLEPLLAVMGDAPRSDRILNLKVCDPAMGSGAFLVEACRFLADQVLAAWTREQKIEQIGAEHGHPLLHARRLVAQRCLYGVDKNGAAVELAKLSLWLVTLAKDLPFTFLDHSLRHGDSLVGLDFDQIRAFHWKRPESKEAPKQLELFGREIAVALDEAIQLRQKIGDLGDSELDDREKARLLWDAQDALDRVRLIGDLVVGAFFAHDKDKDREKERVRREDLVRAWLGGGGPPGEELLELQREIRARLPVFHWMVEYPEVFYAERPDPLEDGEVNRAAYMDAFVGNPPFLGQKFLSAELGDQYRDWIFTVHPGAQGKADLCAHFFRRTYDLVGRNGTIGLVATNTIAQSDTREAGLYAIQRNGATIYDARTNLPWPGAASVTVSVVHVLTGRPLDFVVKLHNGEVAAHINSFLRIGAEPSSAISLATNKGLSFKGVDTGGVGFVVSKLERDNLIHQHRANSQRLPLYVVGENVNTNPTHTSDRYVIDFEQMTLADASRWPLLLGLVEKRVKPGRNDARPNDHGKRRLLHWWQFGDPRPGLRMALATVGRCIVNSAVSKHLCFDFWPSNVVFSNSINVFPIDCVSAWACLQSRFHESWARLLASSMKTDLRYSPSDCFETFPFPRPDPRTVLPALEDIGQRLYEFRAKYMVDENVGLTITYNRLKDPACTDPRIFALRKLHDEMDQKVLEAYAEADPAGRWLDLTVPPYCPLNDAEKKQLEAFEDGVIDRLFALNAKRAEEERLAGLGKPEGKKKAGGKTAKAGPSAGASAKGAGKDKAKTAGAGAKPKKGAGQLTLGGEGEGE